MLIVGEEEEKNGTISVRRHGRKENGSTRLPLKNLQTLVNEEIRNTLKCFKIQV